MVVKRFWHRGYGVNRRNYMGIFLFGFIPLYIVKSDNSCKY